jgi:hypothetical protein
MVLKTKKFKIKALTDLVSGDVLLAHRQHFPHCVFTGREGKGTLQSLFYKNTNTFNTFLRPHFLKP